MERKYSFSKQFRNDYFTSLGFIGFAIFLIVFIGISVFGVAITRRDGIADLDNTTQFVMGIIFSFLSLLCLVGFISRIKTGKHLVKNGLEIDAEIYYIMYDRDRGRVEFSYNIDGNIFKRGNGINRSKSTEMYQKGDIIKILVDPNNNKKAVIKNHFIVDN